MEHPTGSSMSQLDQQMQECIQNCINCASVCSQTLNYCLEMGGRHAEAMHIKILMDCAEICQTSASFMLRGSQFHGKVCGVCAEVCKACAQFCQHLGADDSQMQACADECNRCAQSCQQMAGKVA